MTTIRVGFDVSGAVNPQTGVGRYTLDQVTGLRRHASDLELILFHNSFRGTPRVISEIGWHVVNPRIPARLLLGAWRWIDWPPIERFLGGVDVFHTSDWVHPPQKRGASVASVLDVGALIHPEWYSPDVATIHRRRLKLAAARATAILTISEFTQRAFATQFPEAASRVHVVPATVGQQFVAAPRQTADAVRARYGLSRSFLLYVGTRERRKNLSGLIEIFAGVADLIPDLDLVLVGMRPWSEGLRIHGAEAWDGTNIESRFEELGIGRRVRVLGQVPLDDLVCLYSSAAALVMPSLYEGFGLPVVEAMACGLPVVGSDRGALPEVIGDAGLVANPEDPATFGSAIVRAVQDGELRLDLRNRGLDRARLFGQEAAARRLRTVYARAVEMANA